MHPSFRYEMSQTPDVDARRKALETLRVYVAHETKIVGQLRPVWILLSDLIRSSAL